MVVQSPTHRFSWIFIGSRLDHAKLKFIGWRVGFDPEKVAAPGIEFPVDCRTVFFFVGLLMGTLVRIFTLFILSQRQQACFQWPGTRCGRVLRHNAVSANASNHLLIGDQQTSGQQPWFVTLVFDAKPVIATCTKVSVVKVLDVVTGSENVDRCPHVLFVQDNVLTLFGCVVRFSFQQKSHRFGLANIQHLNPKFHRNHAALRPEDFFGCRG